MNKWFYLREIEVLVQSLLNLARLLVSTPSGWTILLESRCNIATNLPVICYLVWSSHLMGNTAQHFAVKLPKRLAL